MYLFICSFFFCRGCWSFRTIIMLPIQQIELQVVAEILGAIFCSWLVSVAERRTSLSGFYQGCKCVETAESEIYLLKPSGISCPICAVSLHPAQHSGASQQEALPLPTITFFAWAPDEEKLSANGWCLAPEPAMWFHEPQDTGLHPCKHRLTWPDMFYTNSWLAARLTAVDGSEPLSAFHSIITIIIFFYFH